MARSKADYAQMGTDDAHAGNQSRRPDIPGTWQYKAYMAAWETQLDEEAAPKAKVTAAAVALFAPSRHDRDAKRIVSATIARCNHKLRMAGRPIHAR